MQKKNQALLIEIRATKERKIKASVVLNTTEADHIIPSQLHACCKLHSVSFVFHTLQGNKSQNTC